MQQSKESAMKRAWNDRAKRDAYYYVETAHWNGDVTAFYKLGEDRSKILLDPILTEISALLSTESALDIGCGMGRFSRVLSEKFLRVSAIDVSEEMVRLAKEGNKDYANINFLAGDGLTLPVDTNSVDFAWSYEVFQHMPTHNVIQANMNELGRVLKPNGFAYIHFRTASENTTRFRLSSYLPEKWLAVFKAAIGRDKLTSDAAWRGAAPLSTADITEMSLRAGLSVQAFHDDPTHKPGSRIFALIKKK